MFFPKLFNHGNLRSVKVEDGKVTFEGVYGKEEFEGGGGGDSHGIPAGGTSGQVLAKDSSTDYDADWEDINQVPSDGTQGQVLTKGADGYGWETPASGGDSTPVFQIDLTIGTGSDLPTTGVTKYQNITGESSISTATIKLLSGEFKRTSVAGYLQSCMLQLNITFNDKRCQVYVPAQARCSDLRWYLRSTFLASFLSNWTTNTVGADSDIYYMIAFFTRFNDVNIPTSTSETCYCEFKIASSSVVST